MKAVFILPSLAGGGAERVVLDISRALNVDPEIEVTLFVMKKKGVLINQLPENTNIVFGSESESSIRALDFENFRIFIRLLAIALKNDSIIGGMETYPTYFGFIVSGVLRKRFISWIHTDIGQYLLLQPKWHTYMNLLIYKKIHLVVLPSNTAQSSFTELTNGSRRSMVISNPINIKKINEKACLNIPVQHRLIFSKPVIVGIGRLSTHKNFRQLIEAHSILKSMGMDYNLLILGEGEERQKLEEFAHANGVGDSVFLLGFVENPYKYLKKSSVLAVPSKLEGFSLTIAEALALDVPVVSNDCPSGPRELLLDGELGDLITTGDSRAMAHALRNVLENSICRSTSHAVQKFDLNEVTSQWKNLIMGK
ncbi:glycosyltransferase [Deinococcus caeni]|uniref:N-acetylgalactosamine-N, N'-diacetylbacillosaminyl-diphospho-undecaprenol 4-alpha-N-acetylgalactosaminyltransferase n=1 Tax=Deinococcus caeni TaxID=569127 RepID=A0ABP9UKG9_9DEIO